MRSTGLSVLLLFLALVVTGCDDDPSAPPTPTQTVAPTATIAPSTTMTAPQSSPTPTAIPASPTSVPASPTSVPPSPTVPSSPTPVPATATASPSATAVATADPNVFTLAGLEHPVEVVIDDYGFPHVYGPDVQAVIFAQGYMVASQRFFEMDMFRRLGEGRLSELLGMLTLESDVAMRTEFTTRDGRRIQEAMWEHVQAVDPEVSGIIRAYTDGVNAWLTDLRMGRNGARMPTEYTDGILLSETPMSLADWRPQDVLAIARLQAWLLSESLGEDINLARLKASLPDDLFRDVYRSAPGDPAITLPQSDGAAPASFAKSAVAGIPALLKDKANGPTAELFNEIAQALERVRDLSPLGSGRNVGSNNWIVSPELSANGHAMLANDPHLNLFNPPIWYVNQLIAGDYQVNGVIFPGLPGVILGHNQYGAWGGTVAVFDVTDVYLEQVTTPVDYPASPRTVLFNGEQVPVLRIEEDFHIRNRANPIKQVIEIVPHHGPMVPDPNIRDGVVGLAATNMSFRWTGHEITNDARFLYDLSRARNVDEFRSSLRNFAVGAQNWVWADISGDIAYFPKVFIPQRPAGVVPYLPVDGTGSAEWLSDEEGHPIWLPDDKIPQATNPPAGYLATSNNDQIGNTLDNDPLNDEVYLTYSAADGFRQARILEMLSNATGLDRAPGAKISAADMSRYQYDHSSKEAQHLVPYLFAAAERRADLVSAPMAEALDRLRAWSEAKEGSPAYDARSGVDPAEERDDVPPRAYPVSDEEISDSIATSIYAGWETRLGRMVLNDDFAGTGVSAPGGDDAVKALLHILGDVDRTDPGFIVHTKGDNGESTLWDDKTTPQVETSDEMLLAALSRGLTFLEQKFGSADQSTWRWGKIHQVVFQHFFGQAGIGAYDLGPFPAGGARSTVNPADYRLSSDTFNFSGGPSKRFVAVLDPAGIRSVSALPGGEEGNPGRNTEPPASALYNTINPEIHYGDHIPEWINGDIFEYRVRRDEVDAHTERTIQMVPAS